MALQSKLDANMVKANANASSAGKANSVFTCNIPDDVDVDVDAFGTRRNPTATVTLLIS